MIGWLLLTGCPYIFGPPDVSNVDLPPGPDGPVVGSDSTGTTGDTGPISIPPEITNLAVDPSVDGFLFRVGLDDADGDLIGGSILVEGAGPAATFAIPEDLSSLASGAARFLLPVEDPCTSWDLVFRVTVSDAGGHPSVPVELPSAATGLGRLEELQGVFPLGTIAPVLSVCGSIDSLDDSDRISFSVATDQQLRLSLTWTSAADVDYGVYRNGASWGQAVDIVQPEVLDRQFTVGNEYTVDIYKVPDGLQPPDLYQLMILPSP